MTRSSRTAPTRPAPLCSRSSGTRWSRFASDAQGFDGNGSYTRTATGGGDILIRTGKLSDRPKNRDVLYGHALNPPLGTRPEAPVEQAALQDERDCHKNAAPNLNGPAAAAGPPDRVGK